MYYVSNVAPLKSVFKTLDECDLDAQSSMTIVTTATIDTLIAEQAGDQVCSDLQWLL
ncbi:hypothetical protein C500_02669 [Natrialba magadii ATCC 43099]|uniref:Uncharacterized protein n=1 Tax=Natrialba magadii (strain ATCC 43099 / DSM 3394 / CCM 3739 / CIP 104546 / IAM 13178 / JCM 8861 / NBRC 102185 / NCIMB 2190 / MS3) TaxID=547559 RepID=L9V891_NATMM|nr:hypothetical protein C500_02669 [Natrialba magadii ATCC 43099]